MVRGAAELLRQRGYTGTGFREVIEITGAPRGSIYHHFPGGKAQLAGEAVDYVGALARRAIEEPFADADPIARAARLRRALARRLRALGLPRRLPDRRRGGGEPRRGPRAARRRSPRLRRLARGVRRLPASRRRATARADRLATLVVSAVEGAIVLSRAERDSAPLLDVAGELEDAIRAALPA